METYNQFSLNHNFIYNSFIECASTGRAATTIRGTTVHSAFNISFSNDENMRDKMLILYRSFFKNVNVIIIDEIRMLSAEILLLIHNRLQKITGNVIDPFGGMNIFVVI